MTGAEIIKGLECCNRADNAVCDDCPYNEYNRVDAHYPYSCQRYLRMDALALIKRQKAEIALLNKDKDRLAEIVGTDITKARAEAIREFAERIKEQSYESRDWSHGVHPLVCEYAIIEEIAEEMTEEQK